MHKELTLLNELMRLLKNQWASEEDLQKIQSSGIRNLVTHAYLNVPYYRSAFKSAGCSPEDIQDTSDLSLLPILTKEELYQIGTDIYAQNVDITKCVKLRTSGSVGTPLELPWIRMDKDRRVLRELRALMANGYRLTDRMMLVIEPRWVIEHNSWFQKLGLMQRKCLSIYSSLSEQIECMKRWKPRVLYGYTSGIHILADYIAELDSFIPSTRLLITSAELMEPLVRRRLRKSFGVNPVDFYGSMELGWIAWECPEHEGYHINSDCLVVECLIDGHPAGFDKEGELVITNLQSTAVPLIRYATGDYGVLSSKRCRCGRNLPLLSSIHGRLVDRIVLPNGQYISPYMLTCAVEDITGVKRFQIIQEAIDRIVVDIVPVSAIKPEKGDVIEEVQKLTGSGVHINVRFVDDISRERSGKFKSVKSVLGRESAIADRT